MDAQDKHDGIRSFEPQNSPSYAPHPVYAVHPCEFSCSGSLLVTQNWANIS
jgi:hypothetical protein